MRPSVLSFYKPVEWVTDSWARQISTYPVNRGNAIRGEKGGTGIKVSTNLTPNRRVDIARGASPRIFESRDVRAGRCVLTHHKFLVHHLDLDFHSTGVGSESIGSTDKNINRQNS